MKLSDSYLMLRSLSHGILIFIGSGKMGKTCTAHSLVSLFWPHRMKYIVDPESIDISLFPDDYRHVTDTVDIPPRSVIFIDDVNRVFSSRSSGNKDALQRWLSFVSQKDYIVVISSQSFADSDLAWARSQNTIFIHKYMWSDDISYERDQIQLQQALANRQIMRRARANPSSDFRSVCYFSRYGETMSIPVVHWWVDGVHSHLYRGVKASLISQ